MKSLRILLAVLIVSFALTPVVVRADDASVGQADATAAVEADAPAHGEEGGGSMPQLDPTYYASQLFWLAVTGVALYLVLAKFALPIVGGMVERRDAQVRGDLEQAYKLKQQAEDLKIAYSKALRDSDEKAKTLLEKTTRDMRDKQAKGLGDAVVRINKTIATAEKDLLGEKDALVKEVPVISDRLAKSVILELTKGRAA